ncbi:hypothetical protein Slin14017_G123070 [Septoria linicola]|nr:hypothetical protein Slin14017_G123070 [Septoria linicola]
MSTTMQKKIELGSEAYAPMLPRAIEAETTAKKKSTRAPNLAEDNLFPSLNAGGSTETGERTNNPKSLYQKTRTIDLRPLSKVVNEKKIEGNKEPGEKRVWTCQNRGYKVNREENGLRTVVLRKNPFAHNDQSKGMPEVVPATVECEEEVNVDSVDISPGVKVSKCARRKERKQNAGKAVAASQIAVSEAMTTRKRKEKKSRTIPSNVSGVSGKSKPNKAEKEISSETSAAAEGISKQQSTTKAKNGKLVKKNSSKISERAGQDGGLVLSRKGKIQTPYSAFKSPKLPRATEPPKRKRAKKGKQTEIGERSWARMSLTMKALIVVLLVSVVFPMLQVLLGL